MANEYRLSYTAEDINTRLGKIDNLAEKSEVPKKLSDLTNDSDFATKNYVQNYAQPKGDYLTSIPAEYVTEKEMENKGYLTEHQSLEGLATEEWVEEKFEGHSGFVAQPDAPEDTSALWLDTDDDSVEFGGGSPVPADWNASEGEVGHVLNRTHYPYWATMFPKQEVAYEDETYWLEGATGDLKVGETYQFGMNGTKYICTAFGITVGDAIGTPAIGNPALIEIGEDNGLPFLFAQDAPGDTIYGLTLEGTETATFSLEKQEYQKIPSEYIPKQNVIISIDKFVTDELHKISLDTTDLWYAFKNGYPVCVKVGGKAMHYAVQIQTATELSDELVNQYGAANIPFILHVYDIWLNKRHGIYINTSD